MDDRYRIATAADRTAVETLVARAYAPWVPRLGRRPAPMDEDYAALIAAGEVHLLGDASGLLGLVVLMPEAEVMLLDNIAVDPARQGRGIGRRLLAYAEERAIASGYAAIRLFTNEAMTENIALYARCGYVETHRAREMGHPRVYMTKPFA